MPTTVFEAFLFSLLALVATGGLGAAWYCYTRYPWERVNRESRVPVQERTVELTRLEVTVGFAAFAPFAVGGWAVYAGTMAGLRTTAGTPFQSPSPFERVAMALPGDLILGASLVIGAVGFVGPLVLVFLDGVVVFLDRREA